MTDEAADVLQVAPPVVAEERLRALLEQAWQLTPRRLQRLGSERDVNVLVDGEFVLKVSNPAEDSAVVDMEVAAMAYLAVTEPDLVIPATVAAVDGASVQHFADEAGLDCLARLITVIPGSPLEGEPITIDLAEQVGALAARAQTGLAGFFHPAAGRVLDWDVRRAAEVVRRSTNDPGLRALATRIEPALTAAGWLPGGVQHADVTLTNVLAEHGRVTGLIDFGDMHHTAAVCDLAVTLTSVLRHTADERPAETWSLAAAVLLGYLRHRSLSAAEVEVLGELVLARLALTKVISGTRAQQHSDNLAYITRYDQANQRVLDTFNALPQAELARRFHRLAGTWTSSASDLPRRRAAAMGGRLAPLFYRRPLDIVRGEGPWLFARDGRRYLDAYNNVAVVGHAHPAVTQAVSRQLGTLNTHSRYLHPGIVELAERLLATMPAELDTCLFTTSGTEANELAWRLATAWTGGDGAVIAEHAYHGSTGWMADLSSNEWPSGYRPARVGTYRAPIDPAAELTNAEAAHRVGLAADQLARQGSRPALVLADSQFTSEGIHNAPPEFFAGLVAGSHDNGALFLADEVQSGFGRSGPQLWRFALAGISPDLVTLGKPMGAGYPIGAVVTRREIAERLSKSYEYFSTFAATPAAAAAGLAVLNVLECSEIPASAVRIGKELRERLAALRGTQSALGQVRGLGMLAGVDLRAPAGVDGRGFSRDVLNGLAEHGVLAGLTGPRGDVLKIRPPLIWQSQHVGLLVERLDAVLTQQSP